MLKLRHLSILCLVQGHIQKLSLKIDERKMELKKWKNGVGQRIKEKLKINHEKLACVTELVKYVTDMGKYSM